MNQQAFDFRYETPCSHPRMGVAVNQSTELQTLFCPRCMHVWRRNVPNWYGALVARRYDRIKQAKGEAS